MRFASEGRRPGRIVGNAVVGGRADRHRHERARVARPGAGDVAGRDRVAVSGQDAADRDHVGSLADVVAGAGEIRQKGAAGAVVRVGKDRVAVVELADARLADRSRHLVDADARRLLRFRDVRLLLREPVGRVEHRVQAEHDADHDDDCDEGLDERDAALAASPSWGWHRGTSRRQTGSVCRSPGNGPLVGRTMTVRSFTP